MKKLPKIIIETDKELDKNMIHYFAKENVSIIFEMLPGLENAKKLKPAINKIVNKTYLDQEEKINNTVAFLESSKPLLAKVQKRLSEIVETDWNGINSVCIIPCLCPIFPRFLDHYAFMVSYCLADSHILRVCTHEMTHFIYFKKLKELRPELTRKEMEAPHDTWKISELLAPIIVNDEEIQNLIHQPEGHYNHWQKVQVDGKSMREHLIKIFNQRKDFADLLEKTENFFYKNNLSEKLNDFDKRS